MINYFLDSNWLSLAIVFIWVFIDCWGIPGAGWTIIAAASLALNLPSLLIVILVAYLAACLGDICVYSFARIISTTLLHKIRKFKFFNRGENKARTLLVRYEFPIIFFSRFAMGSLSPIMNYIAGLEKINRTKFITAVLLGEFIYASMFAVAGYIFGNLAIEVLGRTNSVIVGILLFIIGFVILGRFLKKKRQ